MVLYMRKDFRNTQKPDEQALKRAIITAQSLLDKIIDTADKADFDRMDNANATFVKLIGSPLFPKDKALLFNEFAKEAVISALIKASQQNIKKISDSAQNNDAVSRQEAIISSRTFINRAIKAGASPQILERFNKIIDIVQLTTKPGIDDATKKLADIRTAVHAESVSEPPDRRKAIRISSPRLTVLIDGIEAYTADWSMYGLKILNVQKDYKTGQRINLRLATVGMEEPSKNIGATVVKSEPGDAVICVEFPSISTEILKIAHHLRDGNIKMERI